ncbi:TetR/AcrR family transcriptional regulator [Streptomyces silvisoli]|uniref:TetR/AcrR family transcriptional regulator n=1 Tax=Streptomyces silvisoli TaxID=3034235 RepID=A0ABT5ZGM5_9ACTN|nr:TetR/AcrR family transcriptional regulator [Streptomyces silvisoli]MDF3288760.1 TetR/AcrR family transcriptional regulator [Streptomyces silvisoli]
MRVTRGNTGDTSEPAQRSLAASARRSQIVAAAIETIAELGYAQASFARIAERAGISSTRLISYHFGTKDELMDEIVVEIAQSADRMIAERVAEQTTAAGALHARIKAQLHWIARYPAHVQALYEISMNARGSDGSLRYGMAASARANVDALEPILREGQRSGEFRAFDTQLMALTIKSAIDAAIVRMWQPPRLSVEECVQEITTIAALATRRSS